MAQHHIPEDLNYSTVTVRSSYLLFDKAALKKMYVFMQLVATLLNESHLFLSFNNEVTTWIMWTLVHFCEFKLRFARQNAIGTA
jgi:hypothetical protein